MKESHDIDLMQHADGERPDDALARAPEASAKLDALGELGELVRGHVELAADALPDARFAAMWREIDKRLDLAGAEADEPAEAAATGMWRRAARGVARWFDRYRGHVITGVVSAGAVAALALVLRGPDRAAGTAGTAGAPVQATPAAYRPAEIESLDTPGGTSTVFNLQDDDGGTTVIWVTPDDTVEGL